MIDVCIVTFRNQSTIHGVLKSIADRLPQCNVLICDNSIDSLTMDAIEQFRTSSDLTIRATHADENLGFGRACNLLATQSDAEWLIFLNPDAEIVSWPAFGLPGDAGDLVGAAVYLPSGEIQETSSPDRTLWNEFAVRILRRRPRISLEHGEVAVDCVSGAAMLVNRSRFVDLGGFDWSRYFMYYEDLDFARRWRASGGSVKVDPSWSVCHVGGFSAKQNHAQALVRSYQSALAYHQRWSPSPWAFRALSIIEALLKAAVATVAGRVGQVRRHAQYEYLAYLLLGRSPGAPRR